jgi:glyoxylase-like metal-dependent hydrolase (beta-lactamase superfamily II)
MCLYEPEKKVLFSGDHILEDISPNISCWFTNENPLADYLRSLDKCLALEVELVLPGHRRIFKDMRHRVHELERHHRVRAEEVLAILARGSKNAYQVASRMTWNLSYRSWEMIPVWQKFFATGEALAHLRYLESQGRVHPEVSDHRIIFSLS